MFDMFEFTPVGYDPFKQGAKQPARPYSPTPDPIDQLFNKLSPTDLPTPMQLPAPLPSWVPPNVQDYIRMAPSYNEGERQSPLQPNIAGGEPYSPTPQIDDIRRLFRNRIIKNAPIGASPGMSADQLRALMQLPGFAGFQGGDEI
jgi:hypothetical protein